MVVVVEEEEEEEKKSVVRYIQMIQCSVTFVMHLISI